jgi:hypothetical protein
MINLRWQSPKPHPRRAIPHVLLRLSAEEGKRLGHIVAGKYSELNHCWLAWNDDLQRYEAVQPYLWIDLTMIGKKT